jgi:hypothetical protein
MKSSLTDNFCSSPWFHIRITPSGDYAPCRWDFSTAPSQYNIQNTSLAEYINSNPMKEFRMTLLNGQPSQICVSCKNEEQYGKVSGRHRQLLKSSIDLSNFDKTLCASPHWSWFEYSHNNQGRTNQLPVDLQIDLGNTCNSSCIMCYPMYSSRLSADYEKLHQVNPILFERPKHKPNWTDDSDLVNKFLTELGDIPNLKYIHFLGGETLYLPSFYSICNSLANSGIAKNVSVGTTTNCTVYTAELEKTLQQFSQAHLGLSLEAFHPVNDYIRWPSKLEQVNTTIDKFLQLRKNFDLQLSLRITPSNLSVYHIDTVFEFMLENDIIAESCNLLLFPSCLRLEILPKEILDQSLNKIEKIIKKYNINSTQDLIVNRRSESIRTQTIHKVILEYYETIKNLKQPDDVEQQRKDLVDFLKAFESLRNNSILDYLPEYEEFLRSYGY